MIKLALCVGLALAVSVSGEDYVQIAVEQSEATCDSVVYGTLLLCSFGISLLGMILAYYSLLEDSLMRQYKKEGVLVHATVLHHCLARVPSTAEEENQQPEENVEQEYIVTVEYTAPDSDAQVIKKAKVLGSDFLQEEIMLPSLTSVKDRTNVVVEIAASADTSFDLFDQEASLPKLVYLVLPDYKKSGLPQGQAQRMTGLDYLLPSILMVLAMLGLSALFLCIALKGIHSLVLLEIIFALLVMDGLLVYSCLKSSMHKMMQEEYLDKGTLINGDASTISTGDGDSYMLM
jgi:hypothetical protein